MNFFVDIRLLADFFNGGYFKKYIKGAGLLGDDFSHYYKGNPKMGDTPSLLYMMDGDPSDPMRTSWGGSFVRYTRSSRKIFNGTTTARDTVPVYSIMEFHLKGPVQKGMAVGTPCIVLHIDKQDWDGYYVGRGKYVVKFSTYKIGTLPYTITSSLPGFNSREGQITISNLWPGKENKADYVLGEHWYSDHQEDSLYWNDCQGAALQQNCRNEIMKDWGRRWEWLK